MKKLVIDIETVGTPWEEHDPYVREYLIKGMNEAEAEEEKRRGALSPFTGKIVTIGIVNAETGKSCALYEVPGQTELVTKVDGMRTFISGSEKQILEKFWYFLQKEDRFISFNGRQFDGPYLMIRSAIHGIIPKRDLIGPRYRLHPNCDLREALNFNGTLNSRQIRFNLDLACKSFGVTSSKTEGMDGRSVETMYRAGKYEDIATYCLEDVRATCELYLKLEPTILMFETNFREAEERHLRSKRVRDVNEEAPVVLSNENSFMESVSASSALLSATIDDEERYTDVSSVRATVFEKLVALKQEEEELPE